MPNKAAPAERSVVTKRWHVTSVKAFVEDLMARSPDRVEYSRDELAHVLEQVCERILRSAQLDLARAAERGVEQAVELMIDPDYYMTVRERRRRDRDRDLAYQHEQELKAQERRNAPTREQLEHDRKNLHWWIEHSEQQLARWREQLAELEEKAAALAAEPPDGETDWRIN